MALRHESRDFSGSGDELLERSRREGGRDYK